MNTVFRNVSLENWWPEPYLYDSWMSTDWKAWAKVDIILSGNSSYILPENRKPNHFKIWEEVWYYGYHFEPDMRPSPEMDEMMEYFDWIIEAIDESKVKVKSITTWETRDISYKSNDIFTKMDICDLHENNALPQLKVHEPFEKMQIIKLNQKIKLMIEQDCKPFWISLREYFNAKAETIKMLSNRQKVRI